jgi:hypothetical protein
MLQAWVSELWFLQGRRCRLGQRLWSVTPADASAVGPMSNCFSWISDPCLQVSTVNGQIYIVCLCLFFISKPARLALFFFKKNTNTCYLLVFYADPPDRGVRPCSASLMNNCMLCIADEISSLNLNERAFCPLLLFEAHTALQFLVYELIFSQ